MKLRNFKTVMAAGVLSLILMRGEAQQTKQLALKEAIGLSIAHSPDLKLSEAKISEASAALRIARDNRLPEASLSGSHIRLNSPNVDLKTANTNSGSGGTQAQPIKINSATYGLLNVSLPLYAGGKIQYGIESSRYLAEAARLDAINDREGIMLNTINAFSNLYKAKAAVNVVRENLEGNKERVRQFTNLEKNGLLPRNDLLKANLQESNTSLTLAEAENNLKLANANMIIMLGLPDTVVLEPVINGWNTGQVKSIEDYLQLATQNRKDVAASGLRSKAASTGVKVAKANYYPSLALTGGYIAANVPHFLTITNAANVGVGLSYSLSSLWKNAAVVDQAKSRQLQVEASAIMLADGIRMEVNQAYYNYTLSLQKIETYQSAVTQAEENYRITKNKYDNALMTTTDLLDADVAQLQAKLNFAFAEADASAAYSKLLQATGTLVEL
ncbi:TolC family protein [Flavitalea sp.]|nr:TolC family protein [Flavitalea sp.]